jgi:hypothetical protein
MEKNRHDIDDMTPEEKTEYEQFLDEIEKDHDDYEKD